MLFTSSAELTALTCVEATAGVRDYSTAEAIGAAPRASAAVAVAAMRRLLVMLGNSWREVRSSSSPRAGSHAWAAAA